MTTLSPSDRRNQTCRRMATPAPQPATPERRDILIPETGELVGHVVVEAWTTTAIGYDADGQERELWRDRRTDSVARLTAADRVWRHLEATGLMAPKDRRYGSGLAA